MNTNTHAQFVHEPMDGKGVKKIPGIGNAFGGNLISAGITQATQVYEEYRRQDNFIDWLMETAGMEEKFRHRARDCEAAMKEWHQQFGTPEETD